jgi:hypothetical protein
MQCFAVSTSFGVINVPVHRPPSSPRTITTTSDSADPRSSEPPAIAWLWEATLSVGAADVSTEVSTEHPLTIGMRKSKVDGMKRLAVWVIARRVCNA